MEQITDPVAEHGEGPVWMRGGLYWVDMLAGDMLALDPRTGGVTRTHLDTVAAVIRPRVSGGLVVAVENGFLLLDAEGGEERRIPVLGAGVRMNEGACDPDGRFYAGSMAWDASPGRGALYRLDPDGSVHTVLSEVTISNGLGWSPDGATAYYVDTPTGRIDALDYDPSTALTGRRRFAVIDDEDGRPDGLTVDREGYVWVALWGGGAVHRYAPDGRLDARLPVPAAQVTACTFGGPDLRDLYVTTSRLGLADAEPLAGAVFRQRVGVSGLPTTAFAH